MSKKLHHNSNIEKKRREEERLKEVFEKRAQRCLERERKFKVSEKYRKDIGYPGGMVKWGKSIP